MIGIAVSLLNLKVYVGVVVVGVFFVLGNANPFCLYGFLRFRDFGISHRGIPTSRGCCFLGIYRRDYRLIDVTSEVCKVTFNLINLTENYLKISNLIKINSIFLRCLFCWCQYNLVYPIHLCEVNKILHFKNPMFMRVLNFAKKKRHQRCTAMFTNSDWKKRPFL